MFRQRKNWETWAVLVALYYFEEQNYYYYRAMIKFWGAV